MSDGRHEFCRSRTIGFKAGQSADGGLGIEVDVCPTINARMSSLEPTVCISDMEFSCMLNWQGPKGNNVV